MIYWLARLVCRHFGHMKRVARAPRAAFEDDKSYIILPSGISFYYIDQVEVESWYCVRCTTEKNTLEAERFWHRLGFKVIVDESVKTFKIQPSRPWPEPPK